MISYVSLLQIWTESLWVKCPSNNVNLDFKTNYLHRVKIVCLLSDFSILTVNKVKKIFMK
jgi:hypothetical protein